MKAARLFSSLISWFVLATSVIIMLSILTDIGQLSESLEFFRNSTWGAGVLEDLIGSAIASLGLGVGDQGTHLQDATTSSLNVLSVIGMIALKVLIAFYLAIIAIFLKK